MTKNEWDLENQEGKINRDLIFHIRKSARQKTRMNLRHTTPER